MESCVILYEFCDDSLLFTENVGFENKRTKELDVYKRQELGGEISAFQIMPKLFYPMLLLFSSLITIMRGSDRTGA